MMFDIYTLLAILKGRKTVTRRLVPKNGKRPAVPGSTHILKIDRSESRYGTIHILSCELDKLGNLTHDDAIKEGFNNVKEYKEYFKKINGTDDDNTDVFVINFELQ